MLSGVRLQAQFLDIILSADILLYLVANIESRTLFTGAENFLDS